MVKLFVILGLALLAGGAYAIVDGWPYRVLERGFTEVILGALSFAAGLLLLAGAAILVEIRRLKTMVAGAIAAVSLGTVRHDELAPAPAPVVPRDEVALPEPGLAGAAVAAGAGVIALGGALAGLSKAEQPGGDGEKLAEVAEPAASPAVPVEESAAPTVEPAEPEAGADHDDWLLPPASSREAQPQVEFGAAEKVEPDFFEAALLPTPALEPTRYPGEKAVDLTYEPEPEPEADEASEHQKELPLELEAEPEPEAPEAEAKRDDAAVEPGPIWWPQVDRAGDESEPATKAEPDYDDFSALREQLNDALAAPEVEPPRRSLDAVSDWMAPRAWPPVTQPRSSDALDALEEPAAPAGEVPPLAEEAAGAAPEAAEEASLPAPSARDAPAVAVEPEAQEAQRELVPEAQEPAPAEAAAPDREADKPSASDEGVVGAYQVGETHFTIYADGSIQARTPDGDYVFASMDELKAYLASEKSRLESGLG